MNSKVRTDDKGIFIRVDDTKFRPGKVNGYDHVHDMTDGALKVGDPVRVFHRAGTPLCRVTLPNGKVLVWANDYLLDLMGISC